MMADRPTSPRLDVLIDRACRHLTGDEGAALRNGWAELGAALADANAAMKEARETNERAHAEMKYVGEVLARAGQCEAMLREERDTFRAAWHSARDRARKATDRARAAALDEADRNCAEHTEAAREFRRRAERAEQRLQQVLDEHTEFTLKAGEQIGRAQADTELLRRTVRAECDAIEQDAGRRDLDCECEAVGLREAVRRVRTALDAAGQPGAGEEAG